MRVLAVLTCVVVASCGGSKEEPAPASNPNEITFSTGEFEIPPGDSFECFYTSTVTPRELGVTGAIGQQQSGGHHITVYYTDVSRPPEHHPCEDSEMVQWHMLAGAGEGNDTRFAMPPGYALKVPAGKQIVVQVHYINTTGKARKVNDRVTLSVVEPSAVKTWANFFVGNHDTWTIPPKAAHESSATCTFDSDVSAFLLLGHMHEWGKHYKLERVDESGKSLEVLYEHDWEASFASHPPLLKWDPAKPYVFKKGTRLRQTCKWMNDTPNEMIFPREMCIFFGYYYPDRGELHCKKDPS